MKHINPETSMHLLQLAKQAANNSYAPYSKFNVGAALLTESGEYYTGCNVENASYGLTLCAERNALANMVNGGHNKFVAIAVVSKQAKDCYPCGACRQWLYEFGPDAEVIIEGADSFPKVTSVKALLPNAFGPEDLT